jgi:hypothetical protein
LPDSPGTDIGLKLVDVVSVDLLCMAALLFTTSFHQAKPEGIKSNPGSHPAKPPGTARA